MTMLYLGLALFFLLHLVPYFARKPRAAIIGKIGGMPYKGLFSLITLASFYLIHLGWGQASTEPVYTPPVWSLHVTPLFVLFAFILFFSAWTPNNIKRYIRHPQLSGVFLWAIGHLLANGDCRSIALFGGFALWALISIWAANRRGGEWVKPGKQPLIKDIITVSIGLILYGGMIFAHEWLFGVAPVPMQG